MPLTNIVSRVDKETKTLKFAYYTKIFHQFEPDGQQAKAESNPQKPDPMYYQRLEGMFNEYIPEYYQGEIVETFKYDYDWIYEKSCDHGSLSGESFYEHNYEDAWDGPQTDTKHQTYENGILTSIWNDEEPEIYNHESGYYIIDHVDIGPDVDATPTELFTHSDTFSAQYILSDPLNLEEVTPEYHNSFSSYPYGKGSENRICGDFQKEINSTENATASLLLTSRKGWYYQIAEVSKQTQKIKYRFNITDANPSEFINPGDFYFLSWQEVFLPEGEESEPEILNVYQLRFEGKLGKKFIGNHDAGDAEAANKYFDFEWDMGSTDFIIEPPTEPGSIYVQPLGFGFTGPLFVLKGKNAGYTAFGAADKDYQWTVTGGALDYYTHGDQNQSLIATGKKEGVVEICATYYGGPTFCRTIEVVEEPPEIDSKPINLNIDVPRVNRQGVPIPQTPPQGKPETDRVPDKAQIDMYRLNMSYSASDLSLPIVGNEMLLEFRRWARMSEVQKEVEYHFDGEPSLEDVECKYVGDALELGVLGRGWRSNLDTYLHVHYSKDDGVKATLMDEVGDSHSFKGSYSNLTPDVENSFNRNTLTRKIVKVPADDGNPSNYLYKVENTYGTTLFYDPINDKSCYVEGEGLVSRHIVCRLIKVIDNKGNGLIYQYHQPEDMTPYKIYLEQNPQKYLQFSYSGKRVSEVRGPENRRVNYYYSDGNLNRVTFPAGNNGGQPIVRFDYDVFDVDNIYNGIPPEENRNVYYTVLSEVTDARGHITEYDYALELMPSYFRLLDREPDLVWKEAPRISSVTTDDGTAHFHTASRSLTHVQTYVQNTLSNRIDYTYNMETNDLRTYHTDLVCTHTMEDGSTLSTRKEYSPDIYHNLVRVVDMSGNITTYGYGSETNQKYNLPSSKTVDPGGLNLSTQYEYHNTFRKTTQITDPEGVVTKLEYDDFGNLTDEYVAHGTPVEAHTNYEFTDRGFMWKITDPDGRITRRIPDQNNYLRYEVLEGYNEDLDITTETVRDKYNNVTRKMDPKGYVTTYKYDRLNRITEETLPAVSIPESPETEISTTAYFEHDLNGNLTEHRDHNGKIKSFSYDSLNRKETETIHMDSGADIVTSYEYDTIGQLKKEIDPMDNVTEHFYDAILRKTRTTLPPVTDNGSGNYEINYEYIENFGSGAFALAGWLPSRTTNPRGYVTDNHFDNAYRLTKTIRRESTPTYGSAPAANEPTTEQFYNKAGKVFKQIVYGGNAPDQISYTLYDHQYRPTVSGIDMNGDGVSNTFIDDANTYSKDPADIVSLSTYYLAGQPKTQTDPKGKTTTLTVDGVGRVTHETLPAANHYNPETDQLSNFSPVIQAEFDENHNKIWIKDPRGNKTFFIHDKRNRPIHSIIDMDGNNIPEMNDPDDIVTTVYYDYEGNPRFAIDGNGNTTETRFDNAYRPTQILSPLVPDALQGGTLAQAITTTEYDLNGNALTITDPRDNITQNEFDEWNRLRKTTQAFGTSDAITTEMQMDPNGNITHRIFHNTPEVQTTTYLFDFADRQTHETLPDIADGNTRQTITTYYRNSQPHTITQADGTVSTHIYDPASRLQTLSAISASSAINRSYSYDKNNNIENVTDSSGQTISQHDALNRQTSETRNGSGDNYTIYSWYDQNNNRTKIIYPQTGRTLISRYDPANRLEKIEDGSKTTTYQHDKNGNRIQCALPNGVVTINRFDNLNRVTNIVNGVGASLVYSAEYEHDLIGNQITAIENNPSLGQRSIALQYDNQYRLTSEAITHGADTIQHVYTFDPAGNRLTLAATTNGTTQNISYEHDELNRLNTINYLSSTINFSYNLNGCRETKTKDGTLVHQYIYDPINRLTEVQDTNSDTIFEATYDYRTRRQSKTENAQTTTFRYDGGNSFQERKNGSIEVEFIRGSGLGGGIGSILYSDRSGSEEFFSYSPVGHVVALTDNAGTLTKSDYYEAYGKIIASSGSSQNNRLANTKERDQSIGLDNHGFRYYDPEIGRYTSSDPIGYGDGMNKYIYVRNSPVNFVDPLGLATWDEAMEDGELGTQEAADLDLSNEQAGDILKQYKPEQHQTPEGVSGVYKKGPEWRLDALRERYSGMSDEEIFSTIAQKSNQQNARSFLLSQYNPKLRQLAKVTLATAELSFLAEGLATLPATAINPGRLIGSSVKNSASSTLKASDIAGLELTDTMSRSQLNKLVKSVAKEGFKNKTVDYTVIDGVPYVLRGNNRIRAGRKLGNIGELNMKQVNLPYLGFQNVDDVIKSSANLKAVGQ